MVTSAVAVLIDLLRINVLVFTFEINVSLNKIFIFLYLVNITLYRNYAYYKYSILLHFINFSNSLELKTN